MPTFGAIAQTVGQGQAHEGAVDRLCRINVLRAAYPFRHSQVLERGRVASRCIFATQPLMAGTAGAHIRSHPWSCDRGRGGLGAEAASHPLPGPMLLPSDAGLYRTPSQ